MHWQPIAPILAQQSLSRTDMPTWHDTADKCDGKHCPTGLHAAAPHLQPVHVIPHYGPAGMRHVDPYLVAAPTARLAQE